MKQLHNMAAFGLAAVLTASVPFQALAGSPEFAYTPEKWSTLRDNKLEYGEIADLVHEYNPTVLNNQASYEQNREGDMGRSDGDIAASYRQNAQNIYDQIDMMDPDSLTYDSTVLALEQQAKALEASATQAESGNFGMLSQNKQAEAAIVASTKALMINYHQLLLNLDLSQKNLALLQSQQNAVQRKADLGMATQMDVLNAKNAVENVQASILSTEKQIRNTRQSMCLAAGWAYNAEPEIGELPSVGKEEILVIDLETDKEEAVKNNYTLAVNRHRYSNTRVEETKETLEDTIKNNESQIRSSVTSSYQALLQAQSDYEQAQSELELAQRQFDTAALNLSIGNVSQLEYDQQAFALESAKIGLELKQMAVLQAYETYESGVAGLASAG
ncbi:MAG: hypothetical protein ACOX8K_05365 [Lachnospiraceae bacterium]|jgi:outer membrane protein TolC